MTLEELNALDPARAERELLHCCGARRWAREMAFRRPFRDARSIERDADNIWLGLDPADWLEAFAAHPRIGDSPGSAGARGAGRAGAAGDAVEKPESVGVGQSGEWAAREQAGMDGATDSVRQRLAAANREYEDRFGFIYIVCATGRSADELLAIAERRLKKSRDAELVTAAEEQRKITRIRLAKLLV